MWQLVLAPPALITAHLTPSQAKDGGWLRGQAGSDFKDLEKILNFAYSTHRERTESIPPFQVKWQKLLEKNS